MLELKNIKKDYPAGNGTVKALKGVDITFRESEFVAILGPSGCGKTTLLNIVGGLDQYTSGDLLINGRSTKDFKDRDWDGYRNHSVGFVFQTYNLIPHQSVLQNVELALSLSGVSKAERRRRAKKALEDVGLGDQLRKKPNEMSGGQMQRVAIARAIVNDPDIILADEPTGALDTETSIQVMEILKEISKNRLIVMVTHNPELAEKYATRTIKMLDGEICGDSDPLSAQELENERIKDENRVRTREKKPSMSFLTGFGLSLKNLFTKKGRTALTSFAGSIGIIGIALIFAVSRGMTAYIDTVQEETLSSYPLTLEAQHMDMGSLLETFIGQAESLEQHERDAVYQKAMLYTMLNSINSMEIVENDLAAFKAYIEKEIESDPDGELARAVSGIQYTYSASPIVYTQNPDGTILFSDTNAFMQDMFLEYFGMDMSGMTSGNMGIMGSMGMMGGSFTLWQEMLPGEKGRLVSPLLEQQYDVIYGSWPTEFNEVVLVVDENNELDDITLYTLGLTSIEEIEKIADAAFNQTILEFEPKHWSYEEICSTDYRVVLASDCYHLDKTTGLYTDLRESEAGLQYLYDNGLDIKVSGIIRPNEDAVATMLSGAIGYTSELTEYIIEQAKDSDAVKAQLASPGSDIFTGLPFGEVSAALSDEQKAAELRNYIAELDNNGKAAAYISIKSIPAESDVMAYVGSVLGNMSRAEMEDMLINGLSAQMPGMDAEEIKAYLSARSDEEISQYCYGIVSQQYIAGYAAAAMQQLSALSTQQLASMLEAELAGYTNEQCAVYYDAVLNFSESTYDDNLDILGYVDIDDPSSINLYAATFEDKDIIEAAIADYNKNVGDLEQILYTDYVGLMMSSITTIINAITYVLIAFVAVSLVVSSIMIGVITLISVQERTKEIGILRAIGASKRNVSRMFNAETAIIGFTSGALGVVITYLLCIPINLILHALTGIGNLSAFLPIEVGVVLVVISVLLTLVAGIIPSRSAAKKDPVVALRTE